MTVYFDYLFTVKSHYEHYNSFIPLPVLSTLVLIVITLLTTRIASGILGRSRTALAQKDTQTIPLLPYWLPIFGHLPDLLLRPDKILRGTRDNGGHGAFALNLGGSTHNLIWAPQMAQAIFSQRPSIVDNDPLLDYFLHVVGGIPKLYNKQYRRVLKELHNAYSTYLFREPELGRLISVTVRNLQENLPNFVSFTKSVVDQTLWERTAGAKLVVSPSGEPAVEVSLQPLVVNFIAHQAIPTLFGTDFLRNFPDIISDLWDFNDGFLLLAAGLPSWIPIPTLVRGRRGRDRVNYDLGVMQQAMDDEADGKDPGAEWSNLADVSVLIKERHAYYRKCGLPPAARADLTLLWATNANSNFLVFWLLIRIFSTPNLVARLREEFSPYITITQPSGSFGPMEPPRVQIDEKGLSTSCPLLKSCYIESLRLDNAPWSLKKVVKEFSVSDPSAAKPMSYVLKAGTYVDVAFDMHFTDPLYFPSPEKWIPDRHIVKTSTITTTKTTTTAPNSEEAADNTIEAPTTITAEWGTVRPFGGGQSICKGRLFAEKEILSSLAGIMALWDLEPVGNAGWKIPRQGKATAVAKPLDDVRVRVLRRKHFL